MEEFKKNKSSNLKGENLQTINHLGKSLETDIDMALLDSKFVFSSIALNYEAKHVNEIQTKLQNDQIRKLRDLKPCEVVNP